MGISYKPLLRLLVTKGLRKTDLLKMANLTTNTLAKFSKNEPVSLEIIDRLCEVLDCQPGDIFERVEDKEEGK